MLPEELQADVMLRIATLDGVHPSALSELDDILERRFSAHPDVKLSDIGGIKAAAGILNAVSPALESAIIEKLNEADFEVSDQIQESMFVFENLIAVDDRGMQALLRELATESLVVALKGAGPELKEKIFRNMSKRASEMLRDDLEAKGPVRLSEVEEAQKEILGVARRMEEEL